MTDNDNSVFWIGEFWQTLFRESEVEGLIFQTVDIEFAKIMLASKLRGRFYALCKYAKAKMANKQVKTSNS